MPCEAPRSEVGFSDCSGPAPTVVDLAPNGRLSLASFSRATDAASRTSPT